MLGGLGFRGLGSRVAVARMPQIPDPDVYACFGSSLSVDAFVVQGI